MRKLRRRASVANTPSPTSATATVVQKIVVRFIAPSSPPTAVTVERHQHRAPTRWSLNALMLVVPTGADLLGVASTQSWGMADPLETMLVSRFAERGSVTADTVRYYERIGLLPDADRDTNGYRRYRTADVERLQVVKQAQQFSLSLADVRQPVTISDNGLCPWACQRAPRRPARSAR